MAASSERLKLGKWLRLHREEVLAKWEKCARASTPKARQLNRKRLLNSLPRLLDAIASSEESLEAGEPVTLTEAPAQLHALERLDAGYDLEELTEEYGHLRRCLFELLETEIPEMPRGELGLLNEALDSAITRAVKSYSEVRERTLYNLDRIASVAARSGDVDGLLRNIIQVMIESTQVVDSVSFLISEGDRLVVRAAAGLGEIGIEGSSVAVGEGVAGLVAQSGEPLYLTDASTDPRVASRAVRDSHIHALYAMPLTSGGKVIGVAAVGSTSTHEFSREDMLLFRSMASRAASVIAKASLFAELERAEKNYRLLADAMPQIVWTANDRCEMEYVNGKAAEYTGAPVERWLCDGWLVFVHPDDRERVLRACSDAQDHEAPIEVETRLRGRDGRYRWFLKRASPVRDDSTRRIRWFGTTTDIDDQKRAQNELRARAEFGEQILGIVSHDLRNPVSAVLLTAETLLRGLLTPHQRRGLERILSTTERANRLIHDLLDFTRVRIGRGIPIDRAPMDLASLLDQVIEEVRSAHPKRRIEVDRCPSVAGEWDATRMGQLLTNLLVNAVQHSPEGTPVSVKCRASESEVTVAVHNGGAPIPAEMIPKIFEPMVRGDGSAVSTGGVGLGLFIVERLVAAHAGSIEVSSSPEAGTTFAVRLPRAAPHDGERVESLPAGH